MKYKKFWIKIIFVAVLVLIIVYTIRGSMNDIITELKATPLQIVAAACGVSVLYHLAEAWITFSLARKYNPEFSYRNAVTCAFYCSFYRLATLGSGAGVAAVIFMGRKGVGYEEATGLYTVQYMMHKVSIAAFSDIFFLLNWRVMASLYKSYAVYLLLAYALTVLIAIGLVLLVASPWAHGVILRFLGKLNWRNRLDNVIARLEGSSKVMEKSSIVLVKSPGTIAAMFFKDMLKLCLWYSIPFILLYGSGEIDLLSSWSVTSLSVMTAGVLPTPAGIGSTEFVMTALFQKIVDLDRAAAVTVLYRVATFIFPFAAGGILILLGKLQKRLL